MTRAVSTATPAQPAAAKAPESRICESHSFAIQEAPAKVCEWVDPGQRAVGHDPGADRHVPLRVGIAQELGRLGRQECEDPDEHQHRGVRSEPAQRQGARRGEDLGHSGCFRRIGP